MEDRTVPSAVVVNTPLDYSAPYYDQLSGWLTSLRVAIDEVNASTDTSNTITVAYSMSNATLTVQSVLPTITNNVDIDLGSGVTVQRDTTQGDFGIFDVESGATVELSNFTVSHASGPGALVIRGEMTLTGQTYTECESDTGGGAIKNLGNVIIENCLFTFNTAPSGGAIANLGTMTITGSYLSNNYTPTGAANAGGAIINLGSSGARASLTITGETEIMSNTSYNGGGIYNNGYGDVDIAGSASIYSNSATNYGGGIFNASEGEITLYGVAVYSNSATLRGGGIFNNGMATLTDVSLTYNQVTSTTLGYGGGIYSFDMATTTLVSGCTVSNNTCNTAGNGNGIYQANGGTLTENLNDNTITDNIVRG